MLAKGVNSLKSRTFLRKNLNLSKILILISNIIMLTIYIGILLKIIFTNQNLIYQKLISNNLNEQKWILLLKVILIFTFIILIFFNLLLCYYNFKLINNDYQMLILLIFLATITINIVNVIIYLGILFSRQYTHNSDKITLRLKLKNQFQLKIIYDYTIIGLFTAITIILEYTSILLPFGGSIGLKFISLFLIAYLTKFINSFLTGFSSALILILFIPSGMLINPWQYLLDYLFPMTIPSLLAMANINFENKDQGSLKTILVIFGSFILIYISHVISGIIFFGQYAPKDLGVIVYSL